MAVYQRDSYAEKHRKGPGCAFLLTWIAANIAGTVTGTAIANPIFYWQFDGFLSYVLPQVAGGLCLGGAVGLAQAAVLFPYLKLTGSLQWLLATTLGRIARVLILSTLLNGLGVLFPGSFPLFSPMMCLSLFIISIIGALAGGAAGYAQSIILQQRVSHVRWWIAVNAAFGAFSLIFISFSTDAIFISQLTAPAIPSHNYNAIMPYMQGSYALSSLAAIVITIIIPALVMGYVILDLLRHPTNRAEWSIDQRKERAPINSFGETQVSPEAMLERKASR